MYRFLPSRFPIVLLVILFFIISCKPAMNVRHSNKRSGIIRVKQFTEKKTTLMWAHHDPTQRQTLMYVDEDGNIKVLAEQSPDAGLSRVFDAETKAKGLDKVDVDFLFKVQSEINKLTDRSATLMVTREALYRLSEAYFNGAVDQAGFSQLYRAIIEEADELLKSEMELEKLKKEMFEAETEMLKTKIEEQKLEIEKLKIEGKVEETKEEEEEVKTKGKTKEKKN